MWQYPGLKLKIRLPRWLTLVGLTLLYCGCSVGPNYHRPPVEAPTAYKENAGWKVAEPKDELPRGKWWKIFNDRQLDTLEDQVNISNQNLAAAEANYRQALTQIRVARSAHFPTVAGGPSWSRFKRSETIGSANTNLAGASGTGSGPNIGVFPRTDAVGLSAEFQCGLGIGYLGQGPAQCGIKHGHCRGQRRDFGRSSAEFPGHCGPRLLSIACSRRPKASPG